VSNPEKENAPAPTEASSNHDSRKYLTAIWRKLRQKREKVVADADRYIPAPFDWGAISLEREVRDCCPYDPGELRSWRRSLDQVRAQSAEPNE
jgi:hypothetical protein